MTLVSKTKYENLSLTELKALVEGAKNGEVDATERLCKQFRYLIKEEVGKSYIRGTLGEDAENDAWVLFLEAVNAFDKKAYSSFPSFVKKYIHYRLLNVAFRNKSITTTLSLDSFQEEYNELEPVDNNDYIGDIEADIEIQRLLSILTDKQKEIIIRSILQGEKHIDIANATGKSFKTISRLQNIALNKLREFILKNKN